MSAQPFFTSQADPAIDVLVEAPVWQNLPDAENIIRRAIAVAASEEATNDHPNGEISVLLCDDATIADLNSRWRGEERPTNVLSFPAPADFSGGEAHWLAPLGDIAIAYETVAREAERDGKPVADHLAHLAIHGFLHLLGYDHHMEAEAERMERLERDILARIGISDPYASRDADI